MRTWIVLLLAAGCGAKPEAALTSPPAGPPATTKTSASRVAGPGELVVGLAHGCALRADGGVSCWGGDGRDQLGNGRLGYSATPVAAHAISGVVEITAGAHASCARTRAGQVSCWGGDAAKPVRVFEGAVEISAANWFSCARRQNNTLWCWQDGQAEVHQVPGVNSAVELFSNGRGVCSRSASGESRCHTWASIAPPEPDGANRARPPSVRFQYDNPTDPKDVKAWLRKAEQTVDVQVRPCDGCPWVSRCVRLPLGKVTCWGGEGGGQTPAGFEGVAELAAGHGHLCALLASGGVRCVGTDHAEHVLRRRPDEPVRNVAIDGVLDGVQIDAGMLHTCVRHKTGAVSCWGENYSGQLGDGSTTRRDKPSPVVGLNSAVEITTGLAHSCARVADGGIRCWGWGEDGQLGIEQPMGLPSDKPVSVVGVSQVVELSAGFTHTCARSKEGRVWCWGRPLGGSGCTPSALGDASMTCFGYGTTCGSILDGRTNSHATPWLIGDLGHTVDIAARGSISCALSREGVVRCFGAPSRCEKTGRRITEIEIAVSIAGANTLSVGNGHHCVTTSAGDVSCWGDNKHGQLGDGTTSTRKAPRPVAGVHGVKQLALGAAHSCALHDDGQIRCWGFNVSGQLGNGAAKDQPAPGLVAGLSDATQVVAGMWHTCALRRGGEVVCWGENEFGSLADGTKKDHVTPTPTAHASAAVAIAASDYRTCIMDANRRVTCWGGWGDEGLGPSQPVTLP